MKEIAYEHDIEWNFQESKTELLNLVEDMLISAFVYYQFIYIFKECCLGSRMYLNNFFRFYHCLKYYYDVITFSRVNIQNGLKMQLGTSQRTFKPEEGTTQGSVPGNERHDFWCHHSHKHLLLSRIILQVPMSLVLQLLHSMLGT